MGRARRALRSVPLSRLRFLTMENTAIDSVLLYNGNVLTLDDRDTVASGVLIEAGRISRVIVEPLDSPGARAFAAGSRSVNLDGATLLPGFIDPHCHPIALGAALHAVDCSPAAVTSVTQIVARIAQAAADSTADWIRARGYDELLLAEKRHPTAADLDRAAPGRPVRLTHGSGHGDVLSTAALNVVGLRRDTTPPPGGAIERDPDTGEPTGVLFEMGAWLRERMPRPGPGALSDYAETASSALVAAGVTAVTDAGRDNTAARPALYATLAADGRFLPRPTVMLSPGSVDPRPGEGPDLPGVRVGAAKTAITFSAGEMHPDFDALMDSMRSAHRAGRQIAIHAVELEAVTMACEAFTTLAPRSEITRMRHRIEHASECPPGIARLIVGAGLSVVTQPGFIHERGQRYLSAWRAGGAEPGDLYAIQRLLGAGLRVAGSSDAPFGPVAPLTGVQAAVTRMSSSGEPVGSEQSVSVREALRLYGPNAAWMEFLEAEVGSIEPGKRADIAVLDADPTAVRPNEIASIRVLATLIGGELVHGSLSGFPKFE